MAHDYQAYIRDLVLRLKEEAQGAREDSRDEGSGEGFQAGRALAYAEVLSAMQNQADSFFIPRELLALDGLDPVADLAGEKAK